MMQYTIVTDIKDAEINIKDSSKIYETLDKKINDLSKQGWRVIGTGPEKKIILKRNALVELLRAIPLIRIIPNILFPLVTIATVSIILAREES